MQFCFSNPKIQTLLDNALEACPCGKMHVLETTGCVIDENAAGMLAEFLKGYAHPVIFCDENTKKFAGELSFYAEEDCIVFPGDGHATEVAVARGEAFIAEKKPDILVACGSGTLHDITRYCANALQLPFVS